MVTSAHEGEDEELPSYQQFRAHATFLPEYGDFVITLDGLRPLLAHLELLWGGTSLGIGDLQLLARTAAGLPGFTAALVGATAASVPVRAAASGALTYAAVVRLCKLLKVRAARVRSAYHQGAKSSHAEDRDSEGCAPKSHDPGRLTSRTLRQHVVGNQRESSPGQGETDGSRAADDVQQRRDSTTDSFFFLEEPGRLPSRPRSAMCLVAPRPRTASPSLDGRRPTASSDKTGPDAAAKQLAPAFVPHLVDPVLRAPTCEFPEVTRLLTGIKALQAEGNPQLVMTAVREAADVWEQVIIADRERRGALDSQTHDSGLPPPVSAWFLATSGNTLAMQGRLDAARKLLQVALDVLERGEKYATEHPHWSAIKASQGVVLYRLGEHVAAAAAFAAACKHGLAAGRVGPDPLLLRNAAAAVNNQGVALLQLGDRAGAVRCFRQAVTALRHPHFSGTLPIAQELRQAEATAASPSRMPDPEVAGQGAADTQPQGGRAAGQGKASKAGPAPPPAALGLDAPAAHAAMHNLQGALRHAFALIRSASASATGLDAAHGLTPSVLAPQHPLQVLRAARARAAEAAAAANQSPRPSTAPPASVLSAHKAQGTAGPGKLSAKLTPRAQPTLDGEPPLSRDAWSSRRAVLRDFLSRAVTYKLPEAPTTTPAFAKRVSEAEAAEKAGKGKGKGKGGDKGGKAKGDKAKKGGKGDKKGGKKQKKKGKKGFEIAYTSDFYNPPIYSVANVKAEPPKPPKRAKSVLAKS